MKLDLITNKDKVNGTRNENDEFYTPNYAIRPLIKYLKPNSFIWCPFDLAESNFVKLLVENGHKVLNTHIDNGFDFFEYEPPTEIDYIISNPPYSIKFEVFSKLFELGKPFAMLVGVVGLFESQKRFKMFADNNFEIMYFDKRISYFKDYADVKPKLNPPFSSVFITKDILKDKIVFEIIDKKQP
tara:strand:+ start:838 stop:1392 length:555 start_codon:yes stop_codon:yes gene_type:complete